MQRILYNPTPTPFPAKAALDAAQAQTAEHAAPGQGGRLPDEPTVTHGAGHNDAGQPDILDQLMLDGAVQDVSPAKANEAVLNNTAGMPLDLSPLAVHKACVKQ